MRLKTFILDVDGVMTTGQFFYTASGKVMKVFGAHDSDGLKMIRGKIDIRFITADARGFSITKARIVDDMGYPLDLVSESERYEYVKKFGFHQVAFMGDGFHDAPVIQDVLLGIAPANARAEAKAAAKYVTPSKSAEGAVMDACLYIKDNFME